MATTYLSPGVYIEEIDRASKPIEGVGTAVAAFVGFAERGPVGEPTLVTSWSQFVTTFGTGVKGGFLAPSIYGYFNNGGGTCYVTRLPGGLGDGAAARGGSATAAPAIPTRASLPSRASADVPTLEVAAKPGVGGEVSVDIRPAGNGAGEDQFNVIVRAGGQEETFNQVTLGHARGSRNAVETINRESKLIRLTEQQAPGTLAERAPAAGVYTFTAASTALATVTPASFIGSVDERTGILGMEVAETATILCAPDL
ncbi:MAG TPA: phage tail sheath family protein, partial [Chloroflexota bacterium]|nr:phage tail sheath family protein [Chloroflexota bacterium]